VGFGGEPAACTCPGDNGGDATFSVKRKTPHTKGGKGGAPEAQLGKEKSRLGINDRELARMQGLYPTR